MGVAKTALPPWPRPMPEPAAEGRGDRAALLADTRYHQILGLFFGVQAFGFMFLQKLAFPPGVEINLIIMIGGLALLLLLGRASVQPLRLGLYALFALAAIFSQAFTGRSFSANALGLVLALYLPFVLTFEVSRTAYVRWLDVYQKMGVVLAGVVILQYLSQLVWGASVWPNLDEMLPESILFPGYNYWIPLGWQSAIVKPNAVFLLEPSFVSQFAAIGLVIELVYFNRLWRMGMFGAMLLMSYSGTGLLILLLASPLILTRLSRRTLLMLVPLGIVVAGVAGSIGWADQISARTNEFNTPGSSGYARFAEPMQAVARVSQDPLILIRGDGAGSTPTGGRMSLATTKIFTEYGLLTSALLFLLIGYAVFAGTPSLRVTAIFFFYFNLGGGGLSVPIFVLPMLLISAMFRLRPETGLAPARPLAPESPRPGPRPRPPRTVPLPRLRTS